jgi:hypothetical protein
MANHELQPPGDQEGVASIGHGRRRVGRRAVSDESIDWRVAVSVY